MSSKTCMGCLTTKQSELHALDSPSKMTKISYSEMLKSCYCLEINHKCSHICKWCIRKLTCAYKFRESVVSSMNHLQNLVMVTCKPEQVDIEMNEIVSAMDVKIEPEETNSIEEADIESYLIKDEGPVITEQPSDLPLLEETRIDEISQHINQKEVKIKKHSKKKENKEEILPFKLEEDATICSICNTEFNNFKTLRVHMNEHYPNHICKECGKGFVNERGLKKHSLVHAIGPFKCKKCDKVFENKNSHNGHYSRVHGSGRVYTCNVCNEEYPTFSKRLNHMKTIHGAVKKLDCPYCDKYFLIKTALNRHIDSIHKKVRNFKCDHCDKDFFYRMQLKNHMIYIHNIGERKHTCDICQKKFVAKSNLNEHMKVHMKKLMVTDKNTTCHICKAEHPNAHMLKIHMNEHFSNHVCETCGKGFTKNASLKRHLIVHEKGPFICTICNHISKCKNSLYMHMAHKHGTGKRLKCRLCSEKFATYNRKTEHMRTIHNIDDRVKCKFCEKLFVATQLNRHIKEIHLRIKNFECKHCNDKFYSNRRLSSHLLSKHKVGEKNVPCAVCHLKFFNAWGLKMHMRVHNNTVNQSAS